MTASCLLPRFSITQAAELLEQLFNLAGELIALDGERDLNFLLTTDSDKHVFKIANSDEAFEMLDCQHEIFERLKTERIFPQQACSILSVNGRAVEIVEDDQGKDHACRVLPYLEGRLLSAVNPHFPELLDDLGERLAQLDKSLIDFSHPALERPLLWRLHESPQILARFKPLLETTQQRELVGYFESSFRERVIPLDSELRRSVIHNDANDNNILVGGDSAWSQRVISIIDFGDMVYSWTVAEPAIASAYAMLGKQHPFDVAASILKGYHRQLPLSEPEIEVFFDLICMRLCLSVCICAYQKSLNPHNDYLSISEQPAWQLLEKLRTIPNQFAQFVFREACGLEAVADSQKLRRYLTEHQSTFYSVVDIDLKNDPLLLLDLGITSPYFSDPQESKNADLLGLRLNRAIEDAECVAGISAYDEYRLIYDGDAYVDQDGHPRCLHLGIDLFMPAASAVYAPMAAEVFSVANHARALDYGGTVILKHKVAQADESPLIFYTLYGHLSPGSITGLEIGDIHEAGSKIAEIGNSKENGQWPPHLHFEIISDLLGEQDNFFGAGSHRFRQVWLSLCPDPNLILGIPEQVLQRDEIEKQDVMSLRQKHLNPSLSLSYRDPILTMRGSMQYLYDSNGRRYLDAVNNVPHVGHCHPKVVATGARQASLLSTNTRYLYPAISRYCEALLAKFPKPLKVCYLTNSGSEANDLALRLAWNYTQRRDLVIVDHAYHGNLSSLIDISPYKHDSKGGRGRPPHVHKAAIPDTYRGEFKDADAGQKYAKSVQQALQAAKPNGGAAAFICESILGCGGQLVLPGGYLAAAYEHSRKTGALCIADEVQVGFGRVGSHFWGFETQSVVPDIVTIGKPAGNGHPLAAVITTREIAESFNNGMEYFNTFGGNPVSCAIGLAVLEVIESEQLQANAFDVGNYVLNGLKTLMNSFALIGDVRGLGLFIGVELVRSRQTLEPAAEQAGYIAERMKQLGVLISTDGPFHNVLKIKPPLCFNHKNADQLLDSLQSILNEDFAQP